MVAAKFPREAELTAKGLQEGAIDGELLIADQRIHLRQRHQLLQELLDDLYVEQPLAVLIERGGMPDLIIRAQSHKPTEQQVVAELIQQQPL